MIEIDFPYTKKLLSEYDLSTIHPDMIIICFSPEWIPEHIRPLFDVWIKIYETYFDTSIEIK